MFRPLKTQKAADYKEHTVEQLAQLAPRIVEIENIKTILLQATIISTNLVCKSTEHAARDEGMLALQMALPGTVGLRYIMTPERARDIAAALVRAAERIECGAAKVAAEALQKAAAK